MATSIFSVRGLVKEYDDKPVLRGLDFDVQQGESLVILGRSGSGKSVTLRQLNGLEKPDSGSVSFDGTEISSMQEKDLYPIRRRIGMLFQGGALFDSMTVEENVSFPLREHLDLEDDGITDAGIARLATLDKLETLDLKLNPGVTDAAIDSLLGLSKLKTLEIAQTGITEPGANRLQDALPRCEIDR